MTVKVLDAATFRRAIPAEVKVPGLHGTTATIKLDVDADQGRVVDRNVEGMKAYLAPGSLELVRSTCDAWTRWLNEAGRRADRVAAAS